MNSKNSHIEYCLQFLAYLFAPFFHSLNAWYQCLCVKQTYLYTYIYICVFTWPFHCWYIYILPYCYTTEHFHRQVPRISLFCFVFIFALRASTNVAFSLFFLILFFPSTKTVYSQNIIVRNMRLFSFIFEYKKAIVSGKQVMKQNERELFAKKRNQA